MNRLTDTARELPQLAACLFDLRAALEAEVRTLTWIQRSIEGIRAGNTCGDPDLLLREIARLFDESAQSTAAIAGHRRDALELLAAVIADRAGRSMMPPAPLAVVA